MLIYELVSICSAVLSALLLGSFLGLLGVLLDSKKKLAESAEILRKASESNISLGKMCEALQEQIVVIDERVAMLGGTATQPGAGKPWSNRNEKNVPQ